MRSLASELIGRTIVLDLGKTNTKVSLWDEQGRVINRWTRANDSRVASGYRALDVQGIDPWLMESLAACSREGHVRRIIPVGHGAAAALIRDGRLFADPMDYEEPVGEADRNVYAAQRDPFSASGSPHLPSALNLGMQLHSIESLHGPLPADVAILPWPQVLGMAPVRGHGERGHQPRVSQRSLAADGRKVYRPGCTARMGRTPGAHTAGRRDTLHDHPGHCSRHRVAVRLRSVVRSSRQQCGAAGIARAR